MGRHCAGDKCGTEIRLDSFSKGEFGFGMWKPLVVLLASAAAAFGQGEGTAYEALRVVGTQMSRDLVNRVVSMSGVDGSPQPQTWHILVADRQAAGGMREVEVAGNRIVSQRTPRRTVVGSSEGATINTSRLNLDSSGAYAVASHTAETSHTVFSTASYTLRTDDHGNPTWIVTLLEGGRPVGTLHIGANKGTISRVEGMYRGTNSPDVANNPPETRPRTNQDVYEQPNEPVYEERNDDGEDENFIKRRIKRTLRRAREDAERMFGRVQRSFDRFFYRN